MISTILSGGLGNQLFQIFTVISCSLQNTQTPGFLYSSHTTGMTKRITYWDTFLCHLDYMIVEKLPDVIKYVKEKSFSYSELNEINDTDTFILLGYFQSYKYFYRYSSEIFRLLKLENQKQNIRNNVRYELNHSISMHFRIGDYKNIQDKHPILPVMYYINSLRYIVNKTTSDQFNVLYFCEENDTKEVFIMIKVLQKHFPNIKFEYVIDIKEDWSQMLLMSCCGHNILANSTFSWWGAYFNMRHDKIVCYPDKWFGPKLFHDTKDLFPEEWESISIK